MQLLSNKLGLDSTESLQAIAKQLDMQVCGSGIATGSANADDSTPAVCVDKIRMQGLECEQFDSCSGRVY